MSFPPVPTPINPWPGPTPNPDPMRKKGKKNRGGRGSERSFVRPGDEPKYDPYDETPTGILDAILKGDRFDSHGFSGPEMHSHGEYGNHMVMTEHGKDISHPPYGIGAMPKHFGLFNWLFGDSGDPQGATAPPGYPYFPSGPPQKPERYPGRLPDSEKDPYPGPLDPSKRMTSYSPRLGSKRKRGR